MNRLLTWSIVLAILFWMIWLNTKAHAFWFDTSPAWAETQSRDYQPAPDWERSYQNWRNLHRKRKLSINQTPARGGRGYPAGA
jgi:hypothetical protein